MMDATSRDIGQISFFLAKRDTDFDSILDSEENLQSRAAIRTFDFTVDDAPCRFFYFESHSRRTNPPWLDFVNEQIADADPPFFADGSRSPNGLLLIRIEDRLFAATFGRSALSCLNRKRIEPDFGIKTAMNMCGNEEIRQTRTQSNTITPTHIDRQVGKPSESFVFGLSEAEDLRYISAHMRGNRNVTLQGRDNLTLKMIGEAKLDWEGLIEQCRRFLERFAARDYVDLFPNYRNFQPASDDEAVALDGILVEALRARDYSRIDLCIPEFLAEDDFSYSFTGFERRENVIHAFLEPRQLDELLPNTAKISIEQLEKKYIYAYSPADGRVLRHKRWSLHSCLIFEHALGDDYFLLSSGRWTKVDPDFHRAIVEFIAKRVRVEPAEPSFFGIDISDPIAMRNSEAIFNGAVVARRPSAILFDRAKLRIGTGRKDKEFCDILDLQDDGMMRIINVKQHKDASSINYLFSQAKFYCDAFLHDDMFLGEIRGHIEASACSRKDAYLAYIQPLVEQNHGHSFTLCLWLLYHQTEPCPTKEAIPLIAQYELKLMHDHLRKTCKLNDIILRFVPVTMTRFTSKRRNRKP